MCVYSSSLQQMQEDAIPFLFSRESFNLSQCLFSFLSQRLTIFLRRPPSPPPLSRLRKEPAVPPAQKKGAPPPPPSSYELPPLPPRSRKQAGLEEKSASSSPEKTTFDAGSADAPPKKKSRKVNSACLKVENLSSSTRFLWKFAIGESWIRRGFLTPFRFLEKRGGMPGKRGEKRKRESFSQSGRKEKRGERKGKGQYV